MEAAVVIDVDHLHQIDVVIAHLGEVSQGIRHERQILHHQDDVDRAFEIGFATSRGRLRKIFKYFSRV